MPRSLRLLTLLCLGCAPTQQAPVHTPSSTSVATASSAALPRDALPKTARFSELVHTASELESTERPVAGCVLAQTEHAYLLRAELASAVRPLPVPPDDLDETLKSASHVELLSAWGRHGDGNAKLALVAFTRGAPTREALALLMTDRGIALRSPSGSAIEPLDALDTTRVLDLLSTLDLKSDATVFVAAEASVPLGELYGLLTALGRQQRQVVLAVSLSTNTTLPLPASATAKVAHCADGLSATDAPDGSLPTSELMKGVALLKDNAADCLARGDARGAAGGRLTLAFRIAANGHVVETCVRRDELADPGVSACLNELARQLTFPPPSPIGVIDIELPIDLRASPQAATRPVCEQTEHLVL